MSDQESHFVEGARQFVVDINLYSAMINKIVGGMVDFCSMTTAPGSAGEA